MLKLLGKASTALRVLETLECFQPVPALGSVNRRGWRGRRLWSAIRTAKSTVRRERDAWHGMRVAGTWRNIEDEKFNASNIGNDRGASVHHHFAHPRVHSRRLQYSAPPCESACAR